jgi:hypothetical protein
MGPRRRLSLGQLRPALGELGAGLLCGAGADGTALAGIFRGRAVRHSPVATESVANIVGRADLFTTMWVLVGFLCYVKEHDRRKQDQTGTQAVDRGGRNLRVAVGVRSVSWKQPTLLPASLQSGTVISMALVALGASTVALACLAGGGGKCCR